MNNKRNETSNYIKKIAQAKSISVAADQLGISQPALSSYLKKVEGELGVVLFDRSRQPLELTEAGRVYLDYLDEVVVRQKELMKNLSDINDLKTGSLTVGGASFFNVAYLPKAIAAFASENPGIDIEIVDDRVPRLEALAQKAKFSQHTLTGEELLAFEAYRRKALRALRQRPWYFQLLYRYLYALY